MADLQESNNQAVIELHVLLRDVLGRVERLEHALNLKPWHQVLSKRPPGEPQP